MGDLPNGDGLHGVYAQLDQFQQADAARDRLCRHLLDKLQALQEQIEQKSDDLEAEQESRRAVQATLRDTKQQVTLLQAKTERDPFALALLDGDGLIFHQALLAAGADGGSDAAYRLLQGLKAHLQNIYDNANSFSIMVYIVANFEGLSRKLASVGILKSPQDLYTFARAFSCNQPLFSFIDVGSGKERADHKIKEMFRIFLHNTQCRHIVFGGCFDNGYINILDQFKRDEEIVKRITLLEATPAQPGFRDLGYAMTNFPDVFRNDPLPDSRMPERLARERHYSNSAKENTRPQYDNITTPSVPLGRNSPPGNVFSPSPSNRQAPPRTGSSQASPQPQPAIPRASPGPDTTSGHSIPARISAVSGSAAQKTVNQPAAQPPAPFSYASAGTNEIASKTINIASTKPTVRKAIFLNDDQHRIDMALAKVDETASRAIQARIKQQKLCNSYHLNQKCANGAGCDFGHEPKLSPSEKTALKHKARELPCYKLGSCRDVNCTSGHHCPRGENCSAEWCKFNDRVHYISTTVKLKEYEDGDVDIVH